MAKCLVRIVDDCNVDDLYDHICLTDAEIVAIVPFVEIEINKKEIGILENILQDMDLVYVVY